MKNEELDELERLAKAATPGPWESRDGYGLVNRVRAPNGTLIAELSNSEWPGENAEANTRHIARMNPETTKRLISELRRARLALEQIATLYEHSSSCNLSDFVRGGNVCTCGVWNDPAVAIASQALAGGEG